MIDSQVHLSVYNYHRVYDGETFRSILTVSHHDGFDHEVLLVSSRIFKSPVKQKFIVCRAQFLHSTEVSRYKQQQSSLIFVQPMTHEFGTVNLAHKQVTSCSFYDSQRRIEDQINTFQTFWNLLGRHFVCSLRESIHEHLHVILTRKYICIEKLRDIYTSNCLKMTQHLDIYLLTFWTYISPFGYKYYNLDIYIAIWTYIL